MRKADAIYLDEIRKAGLYDAIWQAFAVLLPVRTVGVMGDARTYDFVCALRAVTSTDGMTADYYDFSHEFLGAAARRIINEVRGINRVVYDITSKPPAPSSGSRGRACVFPRLRGERLVRAPSHRRPRPTRRGPAAGAGQPPSASGWQPRPCTFPAFPVDETRALALLACCEAKRGWIMNFDFKQFYLSAQGRVNRKQFWLRLVLPAFIINLVLIIIDAATGTYNTQYGIGLLSGLFSLVMIPSLRSWWKSNAGMTGTSRDGGC